MPRPDRRTKRTMGQPTHRAIRAADRARRTRVALPTASIVLGMLLAPAAANATAQPGADPFLGVATTPNVVTPPGDADRQAYLASLLDEAEARALHADARWQRLMHYRSTRRGVRSNATGVGFFFSPDGATDPAAELNATLTAFFAPATPPGEEDTHPQCRFPARYRWLNESLDFDPEQLPPRPCPRFERWHAEVDADSATLVMAEPYMFNPASMYGHTLLRLDRRASGPGSTLWSTVLNYTAQSNTSSIPRYVVDGLRGNFPGRFATMPFYMKVQKYIHIESRDLWEYELGLSADEVDWIVRHAWELENTYFNFYFLSQNCAYQLLAMIEVASPGVDLVRHFNAYTIPADTIRVMNAYPDLITERRHLPSHTRRMNSRRALLDPAEQDLAAALGRAEIDRIGELDSLPRKRQVAVVDTALDYFRHRHGWEEPYDPDPPRLQPELEAAERALLERRAALGAGNGQPPLNEVVVAPEEGHETARFAIGAGVTGEGRIFQDLRLRAAAHDILSRQEGYLQDTSVEAFELRMRAWPDRLPHADGLLVDFQLANLVAISPLERWVKRASWRLAVGAGPDMDDGCASWQCSRVRLSTGPGVAARTHLIGREIYYLFVDGEAAAFPLASPYFRLRANASAGLVLQLGPWWRVHAEATWRQVLAGHFEDDRGFLDLYLGQSVAPHRNFEMRLGLRQRGTAREALLGLHVYF
jgi:hypothetical protein